MRQRVSLFRDPINFLVGVDKIGPADFNQCAFTKSKSVLPKTRGNEFLHVHSLHTRIVNI